VRGSCDDVRLTGCSDLNNVLNSLPTAIDAPFNAYQRQHDPICLPDTRVDLLREIYNWADSQDERCIFWLSGLAGTGKSTIARTVARKYFDKKRLGASFFFSRGGGDIGHAGKFVTSIAFQLANSIRAAHRHICDAITERSDIASQSLHDQWQQLVLGPLFKVDSSSSQSTYIVVVDALDECDNKKDIRIILHLLAEARSLRKVRLRVLLTSRPEIRIRQVFYEISDAAHREFMLHDISLSTVEYDICLFLEEQCRLIREEWSLGASWPGEDVIKVLVQIASGLFIWAATACRFISEGGPFATNRLDIILSRQNTGAITAPEKHLNEIYITVLQSSVHPEYTDEEREKHFSMLRYIIGSIVILFSPLSLGSLSRLLSLTEKEINRTLNDLRSILNNPEDESRPIRLHHPSFRDFLLDNERCNDSNIWVDEKQAHQKLADYCIQLMSTSLKEDVCNQKSPGVLIANVDGSRVEHCLLPEVQYACLYWIQHLQSSGVQLHDNSPVHIFLRKHFLHWLEALSWTRKLSEGVLAINTLESIAKVRLTYNKSQICS
jgi:hypothetical protein